MEVTITSLQKKAERIQGEDANSIRVNLWRWKATDFSITRLSWNGPNIIIRWIWWLRLRAYHPCPSFWPNNHMPRNNLGWSVRVISPVSQLFFGSSIWVESAFSVWQHLPSYLVRGWDVPSTVQYCETSIFMAQTRLLVFFSFVSFWLPSPKTAREIPQGQVTSSKSTLWTIWGPKTESPIRYLFQDWTYCSQIVDHGIAGVLFVCC